jgi:hypothetical protein
MEESSNCDISSEGLNALEVIDSRAESGKLLNCVIAVELSTEKKPHT